jgi:hypothetical protein
VDCLERYLLVRSGKVVGLERCAWYDVGWICISFAESNARIILGRIVPPRVRYGTTCLLIRGTVGSLICTYS